MGNLLDCCKGSSYEDITMPDREVIRQQQAAAAEKRLAEQEKRGIGNINAVKRQQKMTEERDKRLEQVGNMSTQDGLKVFHNSSTYRKYGAKNNMEVEKECI